MIYLSKILTIYIFNNTINEFTFNYKIEFKHIVSFIEAAHVKFAFYIMY